MASKTPLRQVCLACRHQLRVQRSSSTPILTRPFSSTPSKSHEIDTDRGQNVRPRWQETPKAMTMPFRIRPKPKNNEWRCNDDPRRLDAMYTLLLGTDGPKMLSEEVKWLAVTHKSFDQGRRGFNDRLAYFGKRIVEREVSCAVVGVPLSAVGKGQMGMEDEWGRVPFEHPALEGLGNLTVEWKADLLDKRRLYALGVKYSLPRVLRWKPKKADNLIGSGLEIVTAQALYGIVGALSLERGGEVANQMVREKILIPLGIPLSQRLSSS